MKSLIRWKPFQELKRNIEARILMGWILKIFDAIFHPHRNPVPTPLPMPTPSNDTSDQLIAAINNERAKQSLPLLVKNDNAMRMAQDWANQMAGTQTMSHGDFRSRIVHSFPNMAGGEDIAAGQHDVPSVMNAWMNSPPHRANILGDFDTIGVGFARGADNMLYWCIDFVKVRDVGIIIV